MLTVTGQPGGDLLMGVLLPFLLKVKHQQLFFANMQRPRGGGPPVGKAAAAGCESSPQPPFHHSPRTHQPELVIAARDFGQFDRRQHADPDNPRLVRARPEAALVHCCLKGQGMQSAAKETTVLGTPACTTGFQVALVCPAGQVACWAARSMVKSWEAKPSLALAWREVSSSAGVIRATP